MKTLLALVLVLAACAASAQTTTSTCWSTPGTNSVTCQSTAPADYSYLHDAGKQQFLDAGYGLGQLLTATPAKRPVDLAIGVKCGNYEFASVTYSDKSGNSVIMSGKANADDLAAAKAKFPILRIVEITCDE